MEGARAGELRHRITFDKPDPDSPKDGAGQVVTEWLPVAENVPAAIEPISGQEAVVAAQTQGTTTHLITTHWSPRLFANVDGTCRVRWGTRTFLLDRPPENVREQNRQLRFWATEGVRAVAQT